LRKCAASLKIALKSRGCDGFVLLQLAKREMRNLQLFMKIVDLKQIKMDCLQNANSPCKFKI
jgi:hypothetical protein